MNAIVSKYVGAPFEWGGTGPGYDCGGLCVAVAQDLGLDLEKDWTTPRIEHATLQAGILIEERLNDWHRVDEPMDGDMVAMSLVKHIHHIGVWVDGGCLHAAPRQSVIHQTLANLQRSGYRRVEFYRWA